MIKDWKNAEHLQKLVRVKQQQAKDVEEKERKENIRHSKVRQSIKGEAAYTHTHTHVGGEER